MQLLIVRHGESEADILGVHEGRADFPLTVHGEAQAKKMAAYVEKEFQPELIVASPLKRAAKTAQILQQETNVELHFLDELMEFNNGVLAGMSREEALIKYPLPPGGRPIHMAIEGGESELEFRYRAEKAWAHILHEYKHYKRVAVVSHGGLISHLLNVILKLPIEGTLFATGDTGIHLIEVKNDKKIIRFLNKQEHLNS